MSDFTRTTDVCNLNFHDFITLAGDKLVTDSRKVAKAFGKRHFDVLRAIGNIKCSDAFRERNFAFCFENNEMQNGKPMRIVQLTKNAFMFVVMGFTGAAADAIKEAFIEAFDAMAEYIARQRDTLWQRANKVTLTYMHEADKASQFGRGLSKWKGIKPPLLQEMEDLKQQMQPSLFLN